MTHDEIKERQERKKLRLQYAAENRRSGICQLRPTNEAGYFEAAWRLNSSTALKRPPKRGLGSALEVVR
jgi:hypothetical protein